MRISIMLFLCAIACAFGASVIIQYLPARMPATYENLSHPLVIASFTLLALAFLFIAGAIVHDHMRARRLSSRITHYPKP